MGKKERRFFRSSPRHNIPCPVMCGACCSGYWRDVFDEEPETTTKCPYMGANGCDLERPDRPFECNYYLCELARSVLRGELTKEQALPYAERGDQYNAHAWRGKKEG